jgi:aryl-alcohol dehydrogenase-like predicted oxidoreductase
LRTKFIDEYVLHNNILPKQVSCISDSILKLKNNNLIGKFFVSNVGLNIFKEFLLYEKKIGKKIIDGVQLNKSLLYEDGLYKEVSTYKAIERYAFSPLAQGFLTGKYSLDKSIPKDTRISNATKNLEFYDEIMSLKNYKKLEKFSNRAEKNKISLTAYAYQFLYNQKNIDKVIIGVRNLAQLEEAMLALSYLKENDRKNS